ncbi:proton-coupled amino acid transporter 1 isoform X2 [Eurosta solidaginis]
MGDCFKNGGLVGATVLLPIICVICIHCDRLLIFASIDIVTKTPGVELYDYPDTVEKVFEYGPTSLRKFSKLMRTIVEMFLCVTQFGFCCIYFVFITENFHQVLQQNGIYIGETTTMTILLLPAMLPSLLTNLKYISPVSMFAIVCMLFGLFATLLIAIVALAQGEVPSLSERHLITNGPQMALFFGTAIFSYEGIALVLPLRNKMRNPEKFTSTFGVLNLTIMAVTTLLIFTGLVGYLRWGEDVKGSLTLNLDPNDIMSQIVKVLAAIGVFLGYPIQFFVLITIIWKPMKGGFDVTQNYPITMQVLLRFILVLGTFAVAAIVPNLSLFISLLGALCSTSLALLIPVLLDFTQRAGVPKGLTTWVYLKNIAIIGVTVVGIATGTYQSIAEIIKVFFD